MSTTLNQLLDALASPTSSVREDALESLGKYVQAGCKSEDVKLIQRRSLEFLRHPEIQARSFAVLALEILVRFVHLNDQKMNQQVMTWYKDETDLRGYSTEKGWLHAVAHGADYFATCLNNDAIDSLTVVETLFARIISSEQGWTYMEDARVARTLSLALQKDAKVFNSFISKSEIILEYLGSGENYGAQHNFRSVMLSLYPALLSAGTFSKQEIEPLTMFHQDMTPYLFEKFNQNKES